MGDLKAALAFFDDALSYVDTPELKRELAWQEAVNFDEFSESDFLRETAWVILCSGFRESVVRRVFNYISLCYCDWESAEAIVAADPNCRVTAFSVFRNRAKLAAIVDAAHHLVGTGFEAFKQATIDDPISTLKQIPFIGPTTAWHLAKNLGLDVAKPDRHLMRLSAKWAFEDVNHLCSMVANETGQSVKVVDLVMWRYLADNPAHVHSKKLV